MNRYFPIILISFVFILPANLLLGQDRARVRLKTPQQRVQSAKELRRHNRAARDLAARVARTKGWRIRSAATAAVPYELIAIRNGRPVYLTPFNENAAITTAVDQIRAPALPYGLTGDGVLLGLWDAGAVLASHQEFGGRVVSRDGATTSSHATHMAGTAAAAGIDPAAQGMAPRLRVDSYKWDNDDGEMTAAAASAPGQEGKLLISNHSYGVLAGWVADTDFSGNAGYHWIGDYGDPESYVFGQYGYTSRLWDEICHAAPYFLPFKAAGSNRNDNAPSTETATFYYFDIDAGDWTSKTYEALADPPSDGWDQGGFDTVTDSGCAKNVLTVGAVSDAVTTGGFRSIEATSVTASSGWGPTDDGRVKPDLVANGEEVYSTESDSPTSYGLRNGSSSATSNASGSAALLIELYRNLLGERRAMRASALKALLIHTADDLGTPGPDYSHGWGLLNARAAADLIAAHAEASSNHHIIEATLTTETRSISYTLPWDGVSPLRATLCWTDPAGEEKYTLDNDAPDLVNDLDLRVEGPEGMSIYEPYILDPLNPAAPAVTGINTIDNVEQVEIASPPEAGLYTFTVSFSGPPKMLVNAKQSFSLIITGQNWDSTFSGNSYWLVH